MYNEPSLSHVIDYISRDDRGEINAYKLDNGEIVPKDQAIFMAKQGGINGVSVAVSKNGEEFLRSLPENDANNNLENLPELEINESFNCRNGNHR